MKHKAFKTVLFFVLFSACLLCACTSNGEDYKSGYEAGLRDGSALAYSEGYDAGYSQGYEEAQALVYGGAQKRDAETAEPGASLAQAEKPAAAQSSVGTAPTPSPQIVDPIPAYINAKRLNLRSKPDKESTVLKECTKHTPVEIVGKEDEWYKVRVDGVLEGYMLGEYVTKGTPPTPKPAPVKTQAPVREAPVRTEKPIVREITVYITKTGSKYHRSGCRYLRQSKIAIDLSNAQARGYTPCSVCY